MLGRRQDNSTQRCKQKLSTLFASTDKRI